MDVGAMISDLWNAAKTAGPFANMGLLLALIIVNNERKMYREKYDALVEKFVSLATSTDATLKNWQDVLKTGGK